MQKLAEYEPAIGDAITMKNDFFSDYQMWLHYVREELDRINAEETRLWREQEQWEKGKEEGRMKTARNLLKMSMPLESVAAASELPVEKNRVCNPSGFRRWFKTAFARSANDDILIV